MSDKKENAILEVAIKRTKRVEQGLSRPGKSDGALKVNLPSQSQYKYLILQYQIAKSY